MKNYLVLIDCVGKDVEGVPDEQRARLTIEFGRKALGETWAEVHSFIGKNGLRDEVGFMGKPGIAPFFFISCTENVAARLHGAGFEKVKGIFEVAMPMEIPGWEKHLKPLQP